jgi:hypothetical protein
MVQDSLVDVSKPSPGRIYDYILGGSHNFKIDRDVAENLKKLLPFIPEYARLQRWSLRTITEELTRKRKFDVIIDFASGLPTNDHIHYMAPPGTLVIYSDIDPVAVLYAKQILGDTPNVYVYRSDAGHPEELFENPEVQQILKGRRRIAFVSWGVSMFLSDEALKHAAQYLYDWAAPGSCWAFNSQTWDRDHPDTKKTLEIYRKMGTILYPRPQDEYLEFLKPWSIEEPGFVPLREWHGFNEDQLTGDDSELIGSGSGGHGAYFIKTE